MGYDRQIEPVTSEPCHREADSIHCDRPLHGDVSPQLFWKSDADSKGIPLGRNGYSLSGTVDVALDHMASKSFANGKRALEVHFCAGAKSAKRRPTECFKRYVGAETARVHLHHGKVNTVNGNRIAYASAVQNLAGRNLDISAARSAVDSGNFADFRNQAGKYTHTLSRL